MAEINSDTSSGENSCNSNSSDKSKSSKKSRSLWTQNWTSKSSQDGGVVGAKNSCYDDLMDRQSASKAVAIVVHTASKRGYVPLCTEFAALIRENKRMELEINRLKFIINQMRKKGVTAHAAEMNQSYSSSSASESGSGGSQPLKIKKPQSKVIQVTAAPKHKTESTPSEQSSSSINNVQASLEKTPNSSEHIHENSKQNVREELKTAKQKILKLEGEVTSLTTENKALMALLNQSQLSDGHQQSMDIKNNHKNRKERTSPEHLRSTQSSLTKETINPNVDNLKLDENNCCMKSCVKHRRKYGSKTDTGLKISPLTSPSPPSPYIMEDTTAIGNNHVMPPLNKTDKKPHDTKSRVLPKLGDYVTVQGEIKGFVNYVGPVKGETSNFVGIHLPSPVGNNDGTMDGVKYFSCPQNYGAFVPLQDIKNVDQKPAKPYKL